MTVNNLKGHIDQLRMRLGLHKKSNTLSGTIRCASLPASTYFHRIDKEIEQRCGWHATLPLCMFWLPKTLSYLLNKDLCPRELGNAGVADVEVIAPLGNTLFHRGSVFVCFTLCDHSKFPSGTQPPNPTYTNANANQHRYNISFLLSA